MSLLLQARDLVVGYNKPLTRPLSFSLKIGYVVGLTGPNGTGKSTLLKTLAGTVAALSGSIVRSEKLSLGYQAQQPVKLASMPFTGREFLTFSQACLNETPERLEPLLDQRIDRLSGGQFQLLSVWAILGSKTEVVLLDEPTNNLDPAGQEELADLINHQRAECAIVVIGHEKEFIDQTCNQIVEICQ